MAIKYYPTRVYKGKVPAIDRVMAKRDPILIKGAKDTSATALDVTISANDNWQLDTIGFLFSAATARDFYAYIQNGRKIVANLNDYLWFQGGTDEPQRIILNAGFYNGTQLATELKTRLDLNTSFIAQGAAPFTVAYSATTGLFTITPTAGQFRYIEFANQADLPLRQSIAGHLFGLNATSTLAASVVSDTTVFGLNTEIPFISQPASTALSYYSNTINTLNIDQAIRLSSSVVAITVNYEVVYEEIV